MALFKILKGDGNLPEEKHNGWAYVKKINNERAEFYVDYDDTTRVQIGKYDVANSTTTGLFSSEMFEKFANIAEEATKVSFSQTLTSGVEIGTITINDVATKLYSSPVFQGASATANGAAGIVPAPTAGNQKSFLRGDGIWYNFLDLDTDVLDTLSAIKAAWEAGDSDLQAALTSKVTNGNPGSTTGQASGPAIPVYINTSGVATAVSLVTPTVTWTGGTSSGPTLKIKDSLGKESSASAIPSASLSASGVVNTSSQTFKGTKTFSGNIRLGNPNAASSSWNSTYYNTSYATTPYIYIYRQPNSETSYARSSSYMYTGMPGFYLYSRYYNSSTSAAGSAISLTIGQSGVYAYKTTYNLSGSGSLTSSKGFLDLGSQTNHWANVYANSFIGDLTGTADVALKLTTSNLGSDKKPIYLVEGTATECLTYAGGTAVTLNGVDKSTSTVSFYAPVEGGTNNQYLRATGTTPAWTDFKSLTIKVADSTGTETTKVDAYTPLIEATTTIKVDDLLPIYSSTTANKTLALNTWTDVTIPSNLTNGTYILQVTAGGVIYSGVMSWDTDITTADVYDEILLHSASASTSHVTARINRTDGLKLQLCALDVAVASGAITIKMRRMI